jgi:plastocyanin
MKPGLRVLLKQAPALLALVSFLALGAEPVAEVGIEKYEFSPRELTVKSGTTVKWTNNEKRASHSILFPADGPLESDRLFPGESWQRTFAKPGTYPYTCGPHPEMKGVVTVSE